MIDSGLVELSRLQFAITAMYHFLFVPLTLGLSFMLAIMESVYVMTGRQVWRDMTIFWGKLFGINFAVGVATGIVMEFQFGMNWSYYSHYVGDIFGAPLAIEGLMAFFLEATFIGLFFFGWDKLTRLGHLMVTWLVAIGSNFSALWILVANGWMNFPVGSEFNPATMRMEVTDFAAVIFNPVAQAKFVHTVSAGYVTGAMFVLGVSAFYLLRDRHVELAKRSMTVAASFGLAAALSVAVLGDESGYAVGENQKMKLAAMEGMYETQDAPASFTVVGLPNSETNRVDYAVHIPYVLGLIATRSFDQEVPGILELVEHAKERVRVGILAYDALETLREEPNNQAAQTRFDLYKDDLGFGLLLKQYVVDPRDATETHIDQAAWSTVPPVAPLFWSFRLMVGLGFFFIGLFAYAFWLSARREHTKSRLFLKIAMFSIPLPWIAAELGWFVAEFGRQPWVIDSVLPTFLAVSSLDFSTVLTTLIAFVVIYSTLFVIEIGLLKKTILDGPYVHDDDTHTDHPEPRTGFAEPAFGK
jgi:cytochrome bd ubiquinol oxidase subunit I